MEFKGTKGKWVVGIVPEYNDTLKSAMLEVQSEHYWVCKVQNNGMIQSEEGNANALLISKAPEMLEMLKKCHQEFIKLAHKDQYPEGFLVCNGGNGLGEIEQLIKEATEL